MRSSRVVSWLSSSPCSVVSSRAAAWLGGLALVAAPSSASALQITQTGSVAGSPSAPTYQVSIAAADVGQSFSLAWSLAAPSGGFDLDASATFLIESFSASNVQLAVSISNDTVIPPSGGNAGIASLGIGVSPDAAPSLLTAGNVFSNVGTGSGPQQTYPGGFKQIDLCLFSQNCSGGGQGTLLAAGDSDSLRVSLAGDFSGGQAILSDFALKWQTSFGSFEVPGGPSRPIPEPTAALVFGAGILIVRRAVRRRAR